MRTEKLIIETVLNVAEDDGNVTRTRQEVYQYEGVQIVDVADWLVNFKTQGITI